MRNFLIISDLSYLQSINNSSLLVGGAYAGAVTTTKTSQGFATAGAGAVAIGETTYTYTKTKATVKNRGSLDYSRADATALAYARTGNKIASSRDRNTSISLYLTNP
ncbi:TonB-dependent receptor [Calothrix sp. UHCC 0171]|uniref:TonB-dependent receptor n=1 Tax=Calothrix sp. UHCC 0171 TaxID=3110245 RepID=UPI002B2125E6|nr:TonB-dependent receptor [Calothrix sp. UHCC 0171]MEA5572990.1 TonB-dependent receptor [Calothrix sp. UHCC 0171]